jgi:hypothetical protein
MKNEDARQYFKDKCLTYDSIGKSKLDDLISMLEIELAMYRISGGDHAKKMGMRVRTPSIKDSKFLDNKLKYAFIKIDGSYFNKREGISFNENGFIGFGGEFSTVNTEPILTAFCKWCDSLSRERMQM